MNLKHWIFIFLNTQLEGSINGLIKQDDFTLTEKQVKLLDKRSKTPINKYLSAESSIKALKKKYEL